MPKGLRNLTFSFGGTGLTRYGGMVLFHRFCKSLGLRRALQRQVNWPYIGRSINPVDLFLAHIFSLVAGLGRIENIRVLKWNGLLPTLLGLQKFPHPTTLRRFLHRWTPQHLQSLQIVHNRFRNYTWTSLYPLYSAIIDADSTPLTVYGQHEGAALGYNPAHRGRKSYSPLILFENRSGLSLTAEWRSGNVYSSSGILPRLRESLQMLPSQLARSRIRFRGDAAFCDGDLIRFLDDKKIQYALIAKLTRPLRHQLERIRFRPLSKNQSVGQLKYRPHGWIRPTRIVATRRPLRSPVKSNQPDLLVTERFAYQAIVTNLPLAAERVVQFYHARAQQELIFRELKSDSTLTSIPTQRFHANALYMELLLWAYDLVTVFQRTCLDEISQTWTLHTLQREVWKLPALLVHTDNRNQLRLPPRFPHQELFTSVQRRLKNIRPWL